MLMKRREGMTGLLDRHALSSFEATRTGVVSVIQGFNDTVIGR